MTKIVPIVLLITAIFGAILSLIGFAFSLLTFFAPIFMAFAVMFFIISCFLNAFSILGGVIFNSKLCKIAMIISIIASTFILIGFIILYSR